VQFKDLATQLATQSAEPLEGAVITRTGKKDRQINTYVLRAETNPPRTLYKKNLRVEPAAFLDAEVPARVLENIRQKLVKAD
jgi:hypothetical protein